MKEGKQEKKKIDFMLDAPEAKNVRLVGSFNNWSLDTHPMKRCRKVKNGGANWHLRVNLSPGEYQYRYVVDGDWWNDPASSERAPNGFGSFNDTLHV